MHLLALQRDMSLLRCWHLDPASRRKPSQLRYWTAIPRNQIDSLRSCLLIQAKDLCSAIDTLVTASIFVLAFCRMFHASFS